LLFLKKAKNLTRNITRAIQDFPVIAASTKTPPPVDKSRLRAPCVLTGYPLRGQAATFPLPHPQKHLLPWTKAASEHHASTPGTPCVDRRQHFPCRIHKNTSSRGQKPPPGTMRPHQAPPAWTGSNISLAASTKIPPPADKNRLRAPCVLTRYPLRGQAATFPLPHPQKHLLPWTKVIPGHHASSPGTPCVDRRQHFPCRIHKNTSSRGQKPSPSTMRPHQTPPAWTGGNISLAASTKTPPPVDKSHPRAPCVLTRHPLRGQAATFPLPHPQKHLLLWTKAASRYLTSAKSASNGVKRPQTDQKCSQKRNKIL